MIYKLGLLGTHGIRKSHTLAQVNADLIKSGIKTKIIEEIARKAKSKGYQTNQETTIGAQAWILNQHCTEEWEVNLGHDLELAQWKHEHLDAYLSYPKDGYTFPSELDSRVKEPLVVCCDRTPLDNYCYLKRKFGERSHYLAQAMGHCQEFPYQRLYYLPLTKDMKMTGGDKDPKFQEDIDHLIVELLEKHSIEHIKLPMEKREEWPKIIFDQTITDLKSNSNYII